MIKPHRLKGVFTDGPGVFTRNQVPGQKVYGERLIRMKGKEYRYWNPRRSKLAAYILKGGNIFPFTKTSNVLYLGAASGTTPSHVSDIVKNGKVFCLEFSPRSFRDLVEVCRDRPQMIPMLGDARKPETYQPLVGQCDMIYQDISQRDQVDIFVRNMDMFLQKGGVGIMMFKARSVDSSADPKRLYKDAVRAISKQNYSVDVTIELSPLQKDHCAIVVHKRS